MAPHLEGYSEKKGKWIPIKGTQHKSDPENKTKRGQMVHGIMVDANFPIREIADASGEICSRCLPQNRRFSREDDSGCHLEIY